MPVDESDDLLEGESGTPACFTELDLDMGAEDEARTYPAERHFKNSFLAYLMGK